jgi:hypothetical protein
MVPFIEFNFVDNRQVPVDCTFNRASSATMQVSNKVGSVGAGVARFDGGLMFEEGTTNYCRGDITQISTTVLYQCVQPNSCTIVTAASAVPAMVGAQYMAHQYSGSGDSNVGAQNFTVSSGAPAGSICASCYIWIPADYVGGLGWFIESSPPVTNTILVAPDMTLRDCWQRVVVTADVPGNYLGYGIVLRPSGVQRFFSTAWNLTPTKRPTSYIVPGADPTVRALETLTMPVTDAFNRRAGAIYVEFQPGSYAADWHCIATLFDDTYRNSVQLYIKGTTGDLVLEINRDGKYTYDTGYYIPAAVVGTGIVRVALRWAGTEAQVACNGQINAADPTVSIPYVTKLSLGADYQATSASSLNGKIRRFAVFAQAPTSADIQAWSVAGLPARQSGYLGSDVIPKGKLTWLWRNDGTLEVSCNLRLSAVPINETTVWIGGGATPTRKNRITKIGGLIEETQLVVSPRENVWVQVTADDVVARLHGLG